MRILLVEDDARLRNLVRRFLNRNLDINPEILECSNGSEALSAYATFAPDWVLMDIMSGSSNTRE